MKGRKPIPTKLKLLHGNPGKRPLNATEPKVKPGELKVPKEMRGKEFAVARKCWQRLVPLLFDSGIYTEIDRDALMGYCFSYQEWIDAIDKVKRSGTIIKVEIAPGRFQYQRHPFFNVANISFKKMLTLMSEFGMTPSTRSRLKAGEAPKEIDEFDSFLSRRKK